MIWFSIITLVVSFLIYAYYYDKTKNKSDVVSSEEVIISFAAGIISIISLLFIFYTFLNLFFDGIKKMGIFGLLLLFLALIYVLFKLSFNSKKYRQDKSIK